MRPGHASGKSTREHPGPFGGLLSLAPHSSALEHFSNLDLSFHFTTQQVLVFLLKWLLWMLFISYPFKAINYALFMFCEDLFSQRFPSEDIQFRTQFWQYASRDFTGWTYKLLLKERIRQSATREEYLENLYFNPYFF
jgi:hypothetical protein